MSNIKIVILAVVSLILVACGATGGVKSSDPSMPGNAYLDGGDSKIAVVLCHGRGQHPTWDVVNPLRKGLNEQLGVHTLSIQMPTGNVNWREYEAFFPDSHKRIAAAVRYLRDEKGVDRIYLMGHSMGSRMATSYLADNPNSGIAGFIGIGIRNGGGAPLDSNENLRYVNIPVVDVYGDGGDGKDAAHAYDRSDMVGENYEQIFISGANHRFNNGYEKDMVDSVVEWLRRQP